MPIEIDLTRKNKTQRIKLEIKGRPVMDSIIEVAPMMIKPGDSLSVSVDVDISGYVDGKWSSTYNDKFKYEFKEFKEEMTVRYIRFTKHMKKACIQVFEQMPQEHYVPPAWNAKRKRL